MVKLRGISKVFRTRFVETTSLHRIAHVVDGRAAERPLTTARPPAAVEAR